MSNQTYNLSLYLAKWFDDNKYPFKVLYAPERFTRANTDPVITFERDREMSEKVEAARGSGPNPNKRRTRIVPCKIKIFARANAPGATVADHEELADYLVDAVIIGLDDWAESQSGGTVLYSEASFMTPDELAVDPHAPEGYTGVVFLLRFTIMRGVMKRDYLKQARPTGLVTGAQTDVDVRLNTDDTPETVLVTAPAT